LLYEGIKTVHGQKALMCNASGGFEVAKARLSELRTEN